ncbi:UvrD-helicase domain-containing protein [Oscillibacter hominis]|uniref:ATP-dependent DNA helicase PcrA n=1 Tax=Oscillibacter hominis TaxID=2763056 RepID=A0A7G9B7X1_9FIRM|nr:UvrD-helicase domain-containing protein [Oscillibacter hominis]QNL45652.1 UvrD-helicase domain-containing protein [Oscillibacter hominis]
MNNERYVAARKRVIERDFRRLNPEQRRAAMATEGPLLLLAGAGSGKTTVLIQRVYNLLTYGRGSDCDEVPEWASEEDLEFLEHYPENPTEEEQRRAKRLCAVESAVPWSVLAITFTNKAAGELKERLAARLGPAANDIWASTFHSACVKILRRDADKVGFSKDFTIYDTDDSKRVIKDALKELGLEEKSFPPRDVLSIISSSKDKYESPQEFAQRMEATNDWRLKRIAKVYAAYQERLRTANAMDFDDIIYHTVELLQRSEETRTFYQRKFRYVLVDEYQDTNHLQYLLTSLLAGGYKNICVVGDDDQSIYRFRGANIENILSFEKQYKNARVIRLEQNYRSTQNILDAANAVIRNNHGRKGKTLWTENGGGSLVTVKTTFNETDEANYVVSSILSECRRGRSFRDCAVLYRMNAQSNALEQALRRNGIAYKVVGGMKFFDRAEIKDMLAYLCVINNPDDDLRLTRIINVPARSIGAATVEKVQSLARSQGTSMFGVLARAASYPELKSAAGKLGKFAELIASLRAQAASMELPEFYEQVCAQTGYTAALMEKDDMESRGRLENVQELQSSIVGFLENQPEDPTLSGFLNEIALYTDLDSVNEGDDAVTLMTIHSAKGLEFPSVYVVGMEDGIFPGNRAIGEEEEMEEERRLCYVAMTRAKEQLTLVNARQRMLYGRTSSNLPSRFLEEIPAENMEWLSKPEQRRSAWGDDDPFFREQEGWSPRRGAAAAGSPAAAPERGAPRRAAPSAARKISASAPLLELVKGDMVEHSAFGTGMVVSVRPMGGDALVEVAFDGIGTKKLMLKSAGVHMKKL